ncbi:hypothetical protein ACFQ1I_27655 [Kitasatospora arboriphila]
MGSKTIEELAGAVHGSVVAPGDEDYDEARTVYNAMIDRRRRPWCAAPTPAT